VIEVRVGVIGERVLGNRIGVDLDVVHGLGLFGGLVGRDRGLCSTAIRPTPDLGQIPPPRPTANERMFGW
jgi:hypothetical protein